MSTIIDGISTAKQNRPAKEESLHAEAQPHVYALSGDRPGAPRARRPRSTGDSLGFAGETQVPAVDAEAPA